MPSAGISIARQSSKFSHEYSARSSTAAARGPILSSANWRMTSRNWRCSSVRVMDCTLLVCLPMIGVGLVAQCTPADAACDLPTGLPWYFGLALAAVWLAVVVGALL